MMAGAGRASDAAVRRTPTDARAGRRRVAAGGARGATTGRCRQVTAAGSATGPAAGQVRAASSSPRSRVGSSPRRSGADRSSRGRWCRRRRWSTRICSRPSREGFKRPFGEWLPTSRLIERPGRGGAGVLRPCRLPHRLVAAPAPVTWRPHRPRCRRRGDGPPPQAAPSAAPAATGTGRLDGVTFGWPAAGTVVQGFADTSSKGLSRSAARRAIRSSLRPTVG